MCITYLTLYLISVKEMRTSIVLDDDLVLEAFSLTNAKTKRELVHLALSELVRLRRKKNLFELVGKVNFREGFDPKEMRRLRDFD